MRIIGLVVMLFCFLACSQNDTMSAAQKATIEKEVKEMFDQYHEAMIEEGFESEFQYLEDSDDFFWVPPGYTSTLDYDSVKTILIQNSATTHFNALDWQSLNIYPLSENIASYSGVLKCIMVSPDSSLVPVHLIESGTLIKKGQNWKLLNGQSRMLAKDESLF